MDTLRCLAAVLVCLPCLAVSIRLHTSGDGPVKPTAAPLPTNDGSNRRAFVYVGGPSWLWQVRRPKVPHPTPRLPPPLNVAFRLCRMTRTSPGSRCSVLARLEQKAHDAMCPDRHALCRLSWTA